MSGWRRNKTGRPLSPPKLIERTFEHRKFHKTTSEFWQRTSGTQKSSPLSSKEIAKKIKREIKEVGMEICSGRGVFKKTEVDKHQETLSPESLWRALELQRAT